MSEQYVGEIRLFPYRRGAPESWRVCDGTLLSISEYEVLYAVIGTTYGGNGQTNFAVPDLRGRIPIHNGTGTGLSRYVAGQMTGTEEVTLLSAQMASHFHVVIASAAVGTSTAPAGNLLATVVNEPFYATAEPDMTAYAFPQTTIGMDGGNLPHDNTGPTMALNYCIALEGIFPSQS